MQRFYSKATPVGNCLLWQAATYPAGYGCFKVNGKTIGAHRFAYELAYGEIPKGMLVCHRCDNRLCIKPEHLFLGTYSDNMQDCRDKGRLKTPKRQQQPIVHGTAWGWRRKCRCDACLLAYSQVRHRHYIKSGH